ncbi:MAG: hypothetical protein A2284_04685 [Deltaproteobacteria bacterium RIFOXYA12_FULL_61_11]|nr:MAG: hypothetical protein A2284_04685 [Deltaproteobacteria bacterium RIFOXYA12_FULL_61_11]
MNQYLHHFLSLCGKSLLPVIAVLAPFGSVIVLQGLSLTRQYGTEQLIGSLLAVALVRELSPCVTAIMVAAQSGSMVASELGAMRIRQEIDALELMAVRPFAYLIAPRVLGITVACGVVNLCALLSGLAGGYLVAVPIAGMDEGVFLANMFTPITGLDLLATVVKSLVFGLIIGSVSVWQGYRATGGALGVGRAVNRAVVGSILCFIVVNYGLTTLFAELGAR